MKKEIRAENRSKKKKWEKIEEMEQMDKETQNLLIPGINFY